MFLLILALISISYASAEESSSLIFAQIQKLKKHNNLLEKFQDIDYPKVPCKNFKSPNISLIRGRLLLKGFINNTSSTQRDDDYKKSLKLFQKTHFIEPTGNFDPQTCKILNASLADDIRRIHLNIRRLEKIVCKIKQAEKLIFVNVAQFKLYGLRDGRKDIEMDIIVGRPSRPTLLGDDQLSTVILNPTWTIPEQILVNDKIPIFSENPSYLEKKHFTVYNIDHNPLNPLEIDWEDVKADPLSYRFRQSPGPQNTLGSFKFLLGNDQAIYFHDTNEKKLFKKTYRALSSGCVRLKQPRALAEWILKDYGKMPCLIDEDKDSTLDCVGKTIQTTLEGQKQTFLSLTQNIPVILGYITTWVGDDDRLYVSPDPYKQDIKTT